MNDSFLHFVHPWVLLLVPGAFAFAALCFFVSARRARNLAKFAPPALASRLLPRKTARGPVQIVSLCAGLALCAIAAARPQWGMSGDSRVSQSRNVAILLDVSRSMLAKDVRPDRLERAKSWISDFVSTTGEDRLALIAFRGVPVLLCPLTSDRRFFAETLSGADESSAPPGETDLAAAVGAALETLASENAAPGAVLVFSDGGDFRGTEACEKAAEEARKQGVPVFAVGIGSAEGATVASHDGRDVVKDKDGNPVVVKLEGERLASIARTSGGKYFPFGTAVATAETWQGVYADIDARSRRREEERSETRRRDRYALFLVPGILLLAFAGMLSRGRFAARRPRAASSAALFALALFVSNAAPAAVDPNVWNAALSAYRNGSPERVGRILADTDETPETASLRAAALLACTNATEAAPTLEKERDRLRAAARQFRYAALKERDPSLRAVREAGFRAAAAPLPGIRRELFLSSLYAKADAARNPQDPPVQPPERFAEMQKSLNAILSTNVFADVSAPVPERIADSAKAAGTVREEVFEKMLLLERDTAETIEQIAPTNRPAGFAQYTNMLAAVRDMSLSTADALDDFAPDATESLRSLEQNLHGMRIGMMSPPEVLREGARAQTNKIQRLPENNLRDWQNEAAFLSYRFKETFKEWASNELARASAQPSAASHDAHSQGALNPSNIQEIVRLSEDLQKRQEKLVGRYSEKEARESADVFEHISSLLPKSAPPPPQNSSGQDRNSGQQNGGNGKNSQAGNKDKENAGDKDGDSGEDREDRDGKPESRQDGGKENKDRTKAVKTEEGKEDKTSDRVKELMRRVSEREGDFEKERKALIRAGVADPGIDL